MSSEPTSRNMTSEITDSMISGMFAYIVSQALMGKSPSLKIMNVNTLKEGLKIGSGLSLYRTLGSPALNQIMKSAGMSGLPTV